MAFTYLPYNRQQNRLGYLDGIMECFADSCITAAKDNDVRFDSLGMDSIDFIDLVNRVDEKFTVEIPPADAGKFQTIGDMIDWLEEKEVGEYDLPA